ncbi:MAG: ribosome maturation factor RimM [Halioglobus sp.]
MSEPPVSQYLIAGKITGCFGIKGWVKIHSYTDPMENFLGFEGWMLKRRDGYEPITFQNGKRQGKGLVAQIKGVDDRNAAETFKGLEVAVEADLLPNLEQGDFYWRQLQGLQVWCLEQDKRELLGTVDYLIETGANDVLVVKATEDSLDDRERLIPYLPGDVVSRVDLEQGVIEVNWYLEEE